VFCQINMLGEGLRFPSAFLIIFFTDEQRNP